MAGVTGLEPATSCVTGRRSNQLSYTPVKGRAVSYTHLRAHETVLDLVCRLLLEKKTPQCKNPASLPPD